MTHKKKKPLKIGQTLFGAYKEVVKQASPALAIFAVLSFVFPLFLLFVFSVLLFGMLYLDSHAILHGNLPTHPKALFFIVGKKYLAALGLSFAVVGICIFAFVALALPFDFLPGNIVSGLLSFGPLDILLLLVFTALFFTVTVYLAYSLLFFWLNNTDILGSLEKSYLLVKGQWKRAAKYFFFSNVLPMILFLLLPMLLICLIGVSFGMTSSAVMHASLTHFLLTLLTIGIVFPAQTVLAVAFFEKLKRRKR